MSEYIALNKVIEYRNDFFGLGTIKQAFAYGLNKKYPNFLKVVDYPIDKKNLNKRMIYDLNEKKDSRNELDKSGDWYVIKKIPMIEKRFLKRRLK